MNTFFSAIPLLQEAAPAGAGSMSIVTTVIMMAAVFAVFYFLIIRPQRKRQKETKSMLDSIKKGDKVVTIGGIRGTVQDVKEKTVVLKVDENAKIEFNKDAIAAVIAKEESTGENKN